MQAIDSIYGGFETEWAFKAKGKGTATLAFYSTIGLTAIETKTITIDSDEWKLYSETYTAPSGTWRVEIQFTAEFDVTDEDGGEGLFADDISFKVL
jgi:phage-related protein